MINQAKRDKWIADLRSGEYQQWRKTVCNEDQTAFCCLGVLAVTNQMSISNGTPESHHFKDVLYPGEYNHCLIMNDHEGKSFNQIADFLESNKGPIADE